MATALLITPLFTVIAAACLWFTLRIWQRRVRIPGSYWMCLIGVLVALRAV